MEPENPPSASPGLETLPFTDSVGKLSLAKGCQSVFVALSATATTVTIPCVVTSTGNGEYVQPPAVGSPYKIDLKLTKAGTTTPVYTNTGNNTTGNYSLSGAGVQNTPTILVKVVIPAGKYGTYTVVGATAVVFSDSPTPVPATGDTELRIADDASVESKLNITVIEPIQELKRGHQAFTRILVENNHMTDDAVLDVAVNGVSHQSGLRVKAGKRKYVKVHEVAADNPAGEAAHFIFKFTGTLGTAPVEYSVGSAYYVTH